MLRGVAGEARTAAMLPGLERFGRTVAQVIEPAVDTLERNRDLPRHVPFDPIGRRVEAIEFHPAYDVVGKEVWQSGLLAVNRGGAHAFEQAALFFLLSHVGEGGHACPAVCTAGLARAVERRGDASLRARYLDGLFETRYDACLRGSQFLTEVQGGSDVGANAVVATQDSVEPGAWRLTGEKWFCSVVDADLFAVTARPVGADAGTRGLACFLVPRSLDGETPNCFRIRRLKDKLGTRCLASAEIDLEGSLGWPIGELDEGFHVAVEELLNTSRWLNAIGSTGLMRRSYLEAASFSRHRRAFGRTIGELSIVREQLATMKVDEHAALASTLVLTDLIERLDAGTATATERAAHRVLVNANKFVTSVDATDVVHRGIEVLGGNGTIEDFSPLPRLYRDAIVYESWEGTHNVLCAQVQRDLGRSAGMLDDVLSWVADLLAPRQSEESDRALRELDRLEVEFRRSITDSDFTPSQFRSALSALVRVVQLASLSRLARGDAGSSAVVEFFGRTYLQGPLEPRGDTIDPVLVDRVVASDLDPAAHALGSTR